MGSEVFSESFSELKPLTISASDNAVLRDALLMSLTEWDQFVTLVRDSHILDLADPEINGHTQFLVQYAVAGALNNQLNGQIKETFEARGQEARDLIKPLVRDLIDVVKAERAKSGGKAGGEREEARRGNCVINNGVLSVYQDIFFRFARGHLTEIPRRLAESVEVREILEPLTPRVKANIQDVMVVTERRPDIASNGPLYGTAIYNLRNFAVLHMQELYDNWSRFPGGVSKYTRNVRHWINQMNGANRPNPCYVDEAARDRWLRENAGAQSNVYEPTLEAVRDMFQNLYENLEVWTRVIYRYSCQMNP